VGVGGEVPEGVYRELGRELALLHGAGPAALAGVPGGVPVDEGGDPRPGIEALASAGQVSAGLARWLLGWLDELARQVGEPPRPCLIHGDIAAGNLLVDPGTGALAALLDWGDAAIADPAVEFAKVPPRAVPHVLAGYLGDVDDAVGREWAARVLWHHVVWAVLRLGTPPDPVAAHWSAQPGNRLLELLRAYVEAGWMRSQRLPERGR
jgi:hygromycin-B 7''-O-kinase